MGEKSELEKKLQYWFESFISKGTLTMIILLFLATFLVACIVGIIASLICGGNPIIIIWDSLMHTLDPGILYSDPRDNTINLIFMSFMTLFGIFFTSVLIGIITSSFERKIHEMRLGTSKVMEKGHVVVLGYRYTIFKIVESIIEANANHKRQCVVVVGDEKTEVMLDAIRSHIAKFKTTKLICRSGKTYEEYVLERASVENAKSVFINGKSDIQSLKTVLAFMSYIKDKENVLYNPDLYVTVVVYDKKYIKAIQSAGGKRVQVVYAQDFISKMIAHACNQRGLCSVYDELLDFQKNEIYCEKIEELYDMSFKDVLHSFKKQIPIGILRKKENGEEIPLINPPMDTIIEKNDKIILFEEDDGSYKSKGSFKPSKDRYEFQEDKIIKLEDSEKKSVSKLIILGQNERLENILLEYNRNLKENFKLDGRAFVKIVDTLDKEKFKIDEEKYENLEIQYEKVNDFNGENIRRVLDNEDFNVLILTNEDVDYEEADSDSMLKLIELSKIAKEKDFSITCEIRKSSNQKIAETIGSGNFIVGSNVCGLLSVQVAENRNMVKIFEELLGTEGSELYMKPVTDYVKPNVSINFDTIIDVFSMQNSIVLGFRKIDNNNKAELTTCPERAKEYTFHKNDKFIVLSKEL